MGASLLVVAKSIYLSVNYYFSIFELFPYDGRARIRNFSSNVEKYFTRAQTPMKYQTISLFMIVFAVKGAIYYVALATVIFHL